MPLNGAGTRLVAFYDLGQVFEGHFEIQPNASTYPVNGEPLATVLALPVFGDRVKYIPGVKPDTVEISTNLGHNWTFDKTQGTMGTFRNWTSVGASPSEHANAGYSGTETNAILYVRIVFPKFKSISN